MSRVRNLCVERRVLDFDHIQIPKVAQHLLRIHSDLIGQDNALFFVLVLSTLLGLFVGLAFHELCLAAAATLLGDDLPRRQGRLTLNPLAHLDPIGTLMMLFVGFGFAKPVQHNPNGLKIAPKTATLLVAAAGPLSNLVSALLLALPIKLGWVPYINPFGSVAGVHGTNEYIGLFLTGGAYINVILGVFNLIPIPPLDGFNVALGVLPDSMSREFAKLNRYGFGILVVLLFGVPYVTQALTGTSYSPVQEIMIPVATPILRFVTGIR